MANAMKEATKAQGSSLSPPSHSQFEFDMQLFEDEKKIFQDVLPTPQPDKFFLI